MKNNSISAVIIDDSDEELVVVPEKTKRTTDGRTIKPRTTVK